MTEPLLVGIAGGSGAGKTTLAHCLLERIAPDRGVRIPFDAYYRDLAHLTPDERERRNFDDPDALDVDLLAHHLDRLRAGHAVEVPRYDFTSHTRESIARTVHPAPVVVVEGVLVLALEPIRSRLDLGVFVDTPWEVRLERRVRRDAGERGRNRASVVRQWKTTVDPMHARFVDPSRRHAHLVVAGEGPVPETAGPIVRRVRAARSRSVR